MTKIVKLHKEIKLIQGYLNLNKDAFDYYEKVRRDTQNNVLSEQLKFFEIFHGMAIERFQHELDIIGVDEIDQQPHDTFTGVFNQFMGDVASLIKNNPDKVFLEKLENAELRCMQFLEEHTQNQELSPRMKQVLENEHIEINKMYKYIHNLKKKIAA